ncbi:MAG: DUF4381 domain-containing protein [Rhodanobacteraceae bacterium]
MTNPLAGSGPVLRDIHVPRVSWWPPAPGWWLLAMMILVLIVAIAMFWLHLRRRRHPWLTARRELDSLAACRAGDRDDVALAAGVSRLLRRIALAIEPAAAATDGAAWQDFIERRGPGVFTLEQLDRLIDAPYRAHSSFDAPALLAAARKWCERALRQRGLHRRGGWLPHPPRPACLSTSPQRGEGWGVAETSATLARHAPSSSS